LVGTVTSDLHEDFILSRLFKKIAFAVENQAENQKQIAFGVAE
jgi:hypothetical protein